MRMQELAVAQKLALNKCCTHWENIRVILGLYRDNGKENGNYYILMGYMLGFHFLGVPQEHQTLVPMLLG